MRSRRALAQDSVGLFRDILDLHTGHGAIMALQAPVRNHTHIGRSGRLQWAGQPARWLCWAARCRIPEFTELGKKIRRHLPSIHATLDHGLPR